ncbi:MFS transporter [Aestuariibius sp. 2305UL40-4]|uniref:MFS transporter n=1 Tax=Aestuariibius violaceus TaxID=3234132 RepID=UPI00345F03EE
MAAERTSWAVVVLIWLAGLGAAAQYAKISVVFDRLPELYPEAGEALGFAVSLVGVTGIVLGVVAGLLVARIGYRRSLFGALLLGGTISLYQATTPAFPLFLTSRVIEGISHLALVVAAPTLIAQVTKPRDAGLALTLWGTFFGVAFALLTFLGLPFAARWGVPALFLAHGAYLIGFAAILSIWLPRDEWRAAQPIRLTDLLSRHGIIYRSPRISAPAIGWLFYTFCFVSLLTLLPPYLTPENRLWVMTAIPLISILSSMTLGVFLLKWLHPVRVIEIGFVTSAATALALLALPGNPALCLALAAGMGLVQGASFAAVPRLNPDDDDRAASNGAIAQTGNIGNTLGTPVLLGIIGFAGHAGFMLTLAVALSLGALSHWALATRRRRGSA